MWYRVDWDRLIVLLLPTFLRKPVLFGYIKAMVSPLAIMHYNWEQMRTANLITLSYNGQRCYLRKALNDKFDNKLRRIAIDDTAQLDQDYIYTSAENLDVYLGILYLEQEFNYVNSSVDFLVNVPGTILSLNRNAITALVDFYKLAGKSYNLVSI